MKSGQNSKCKMTLIQFEVSSRGHIMLILGGNNTDFMAASQLYKREKNEWPFSAGYWDLFRNEVQKSRGARASAHENLRLSAQARKKRNSCGGAAARASRK